MAERRNPKRAKHDLPRSRQACVQHRDHDVRAFGGQVSNCVWLAGRAEDKINEAIETHVTAGCSCIAIVDPPREGPPPSSFALPRGSCNALGRGSSTLTLTLNP